MSCRFCVGCLLAILPLFRIYCLGGEGLIDSSASGEISAPINKPTFSGVLPKGLVDNFGAPGEVTGSVQDEGGAKFFRLEVKKGNGAQFYYTAAAFALQSGDRLRLSVRYRAADKAKIGFGLRQGTAPYTMYWSHDYAGGGWQTQTTVFVLDQNPAADSGFFLYLKSADVFDIAFLRLERLPRDIAAGVQESAPTFQDGDTVCLIGDSITHLGYYQLYLQELLTLRQPDIKVTLVNCGVSGQVVPSILGLFDKDVAPHKPNYAFVMLGMNDVGRGDFKPGNTPEQTAQLAQKKAAVFQNNLQLLCGRIKALNVRNTVLLSPTPYDEWQQSKEPVLTGCDQGLLALGRAGAQVAADNGCGFIDVHEPLLAAIRAALKVNPAKSLIWADRVHPGNAGGLVIALAIYQRMYGPSLLSAEVDAASLLTKAVGCRVEAAQKTADGMTFELASAVYPFAPGDRVLDAVPLKALCAAAAAFTLRVTGLPAGNYALHSGGKALGTFTAAQLAAGLELGNLSELPCTATAIRVDELLRKRQLIEQQKIRNVVAAMCFYPGDAANLRAKGVQLPENPPEAMKILIEKNGPGYLTGLYKDYLNYHSPAEQEKARAELADCDRQIQSLRQPWQATVRIQKTP